MEVREMGILLPLSFTTRKLMLGIKLGIESSALSFLLRVLVHIVDYYFDLTDAVGSKVSRQRTERVLIAR
jgi:hypothetical protein